MTIRLLAAALGGTLALWGCGPQQPAAGQSNYKPVEDKLLYRAAIGPSDYHRVFPLTVGNQWVYEIEAVLRDERGQRPSNAVLTLRVTNVTVLGDKKIATIEAVLDGKVNERQRWQLDSKGLYQLAIGFPQIPFEPPQPALLFPFKAKDVIEWKGRGYTPLTGEVKDARARTDILGIEEVDTGLGRMEGWATVSQLEWSGGAARSKTWWTPGVGISRYRQEIIGPGRLITQVMRLKSMTLRPEATE